MSARDPPTADIFYRRGLLSKNWINVPVPFEWLSAATKRVSKTINNHYMSQIQMYGMPKGLSIKDVCTESQKN